MKRRTIGRYYTKHTLVEFEDSDFDEDGRLKPEFDADDGPLIDQSFASFAEHMIAHFGSFLRKRGMPDSRGVSFRPGRPTEWEACPEMIDSLGRPRRNWLRLDGYIRKHRGVEHDSPEDLAARILCEAYEIKGSLEDHKLALHRAFNLGRLDLLFHIYLSEDRKRQKARQRKGRAWAEKLAEDLMTCASRDEAWSAIPEAEVTSDEPNIEAGGRGWIVYRDGDDLVAKDNRTGADEKIRRTTFLKRYLKLNRR